MMMMRYSWLSQYPRVFLSVTGLRVAEFEQLVKDVLPQYGEAEQARLERAERQRAMGGGHPFELVPRDHVLLTVIWLRVYPVHEVLGYLFGVSDSTVSRVIERVLPVLEQAGRDTMRMPEPGRKRRRQLDDLLRDTTELVVVIDTFEQRVQRPRGKDKAEAFARRATHPQEPKYGRWRQTPMATAYQALQRITLFEAVVDGALPEVVVSGTRPIRALLNCILIGDRVSRMVNPALPRM
jgi:hypothetical protein